MAQHDKERRIAVLEDREATEDDIATLAGLMESNDVEIALGAARALLRHGYGEAT